MSIRKTKKEGKREEDRRAIINAMQLTRKKLVEADPIR